MSTQMAEFRAAGEQAAKAEQVSAKSAADAKSAAEQAAAGHGRRIDEALGAAREKGVAGAMAEAGELVSQLRQRVQLDERITQLATRETELAEESREHLENQMLPAWVLVGLGTLFVLGCALVLLFMAGLVFSSALGSSLTWPVGFVGVGAAGAAGAIKFAMERAAERRLEHCHQQIDLLARQADEARAERDALDSKLPRGGGPLVARLQAAEKSLSRLEDLLPLEVQRESAQHEADNLRSQFHALRDRAREARAVVKHAHKPAAEQASREGDGVRAVETAREAGRYDRRHALAARARGQRSGP